MAVEEGPAMPQMATESAGGNALPIILHAIGIAVGIYLGLLAMDAIAPDLPPADTEAGLIAPAQVGQVGANADNSLFRADSLARALETLDQQLGTDGVLTRVHVEPSRLTTETSSDLRGFELEAVDPAAPERIIAALTAERSDIEGLGDAVSFDFRIDAEKRLGWYVQLDLAIAPPRAFTAAPDGSRVRPGGAP